MGARAMRMNPATRTRGQGRMMMNAFCFLSFLFSSPSVVDASTQAATWCPQAAAEANKWQDVTYGNNLFVAVASDGTNRVMTSTNGTTWTARNAAEANSWRGVTYGNNLFVAVAKSGTNRVMTSADGTTWTARNAAEAN